RIGGGPTTRGPARPARAGDRAADQARPAHDRPISRGGRSVTRVASAVASPTYGRRGVHGLVTGPREPRAEVGEPADRAGRPNCADPCLAEGHALVTAHSGSSV